MCLTDGGPPHHSYNFLNRRQWRALAEELRPLFFTTELVSDSLNHKGSADMGYRRFRRPPFWSCFGLSSVLVLRGTRRELSICGRIIEIGEILVFVKDLFFGSRESISRFFFLKDQEIRFLTPWFRPAS